MISRGHLPSPAQCSELTDLFGCLLDTGHTLEEAVLFLLQLTDDATDADMRITTSVAA